MDNNRYQKALKFIYGRQHFGIKLGLDNIWKFAGWLDNPQDKYRTIHIAGTNGKGSTASFIVSILKAAGYKVGLLTSPHLADFRERIRINGKKISENAIAEFVENHKPIILKSKVTFFEVTTALAFWYFSREKVDWAILETGLGGRLDATNIVTPEVSVITNISLEHTNLLGRTIYKIAGEKGGIIKPGVPVVTGIINNGSDAARRIREICRERDSELYFRPGNGYRHKYTGGNDFIYISKGRFKGIRFETSLAGCHQAENAFLASRVAEVLCQRGFMITRQALGRGLKTNYWPGRFMPIRKNPTVIIDVAHNREGFWAVLNTLKNRYPGRKFDFLIGMVEKKHGDKCVRSLGSLANSISLAPLENERSDDPYFLASRLNFKKLSVRLYPTASIAIKDLLENSHPSDILILMGSHFLMGELAPFIKRDGF